jgi:hypothetical protein
MTRPAPERFAIAAVAGFALAVCAMRIASAQSDLDAFMRQVMERRDDNWTKLQQYILDEREELDIRGPGGVPVWGQRADYTWFIQEGFFVRSPVRVNGVTIGEDDRRKAEAEYLRRAQAREKRAMETEPESVRDVESFVKQTRQPEFISSAYFLRFKFDSGRYALVGHEQLEGREVLRVEYYPLKLFTAEDSRERQKRREAEQRNRQETEQDKRVSETVNRLLNRGSRVTLWIEPTEHQILKYTFDNVDVDFFPARWMASVTGLHATMAMGQPFPGVWMPRDTDIQIGLMLAVGEVDVRYTLAYHDYRQAEVTTGIRTPGAR